MNLPKITIAIPTFNEEENIVACLESIFLQKYPKELVEVILVDDYSTDSTVEKAKKFPVKIIYNGRKDAEVGKMLAFRESKGDLFYYLDADAKLAGNDWFNKMIKPFTDDEAIVGVFTKELAYDNSNSIERYFAMDPLLRDPLHEIFSASVDSVTVRRLRDYAICQFKPSKIPPAGRCIYKIDILNKLIKSEQKFMEMDILWLLVINGFTKFAYVPKAGIYHRYITNLVDLVEKRKRNIQKVYLDNLEKRKYMWINPGKPLDILKIVIIVLYANTFIFSILRGIYKTIRFKDIAGLLEPIVSFISVNATVVSMLLHRRMLEFIFNLQKP